MGAAGLSVAGCQAAVKPVETDDGGSCRVEGEDGGLRCSEYQPELWSQEVDILFVIDNSGSMGEEQGRLAAAIDALIGPLEAASVGIRIGITTTDNGNPLCGADTSPEGGALQLSSCRGRLGEFTLGGQEPLIMFDVACADHCALEPAQLDELMRPTRLGSDPEHRLRPWIESIPGSSNLPEGVSVSDAARCFLPQGIAGCGLESQLESMYKAVQRTGNVDESSHGFLRDEATLAIVILTDEADCSYASEWAAIFTEDGGKVFWSDPEASYPTSAVCWNAGVECTGGPGVYDECHALDKDIDGAFTSDPGEAVLHPLGRYVDLVQKLQIERQVRNPYNDVVLAVIAGVPENYSPADAQGLYADADDPQFQNDFGIGPGCVTVGEYGRGVPPVRMRELEEAIGAPNLFSVCADDYRPALAAIADDILEHVRPACFRECAADTDADRGGLQPECFVEQSVVGEPSTAIPECRVSEGVFALPSADDDVCFAYRTDPNSTGSPLDDLSDECVENGFNLEIQIVRRDDAPAPSGASITTTCQLSEHPEDDCPDLGS